MDLPMLVLPTPGGPTSSTMEPAISPLKAPTARNSRMRFFTSSRPAWCLSSTLRACRRSSLSLPSTPQGTEVAQSR
ncbi:hypothetical protein D9M71_489830 [compost metagenome]